MKRLLAAAFILCASCAELPSAPVNDLPVQRPLAQASTLTFKLVIPIQFTGFACTEFVPLQGELLMIQHLGSNDNGTHAKVLFLQKLTGEGQVSGRRYVAIGINNAGGSTSAHGAEPSHEVFNFRLVGNGDVMQVKSRVRLTTNANGEITADFSEFSVVCR